MTGRAKVQFVVLLVLVALMFSALVALVRVAAQVPCIPPACSTPPPSPTGNQTAAPPSGGDYPRWAWHVAWGGTILLGFVVALKVVLPARTFEKLFDWCRRRPR